MLLAAVVTPGHVDDPSGRDRHQQKSLSFPKSYCNDAIAFEFALNASTLLPVLLRFPIIPPQWIYSAVLLLKDEACPVGMVPSFMAPLLGAGSRALCGHTGPH